MATILQSRSNPNVDRVRLLSMREVAEQLECRCSAPTKWVAVDWFRWFVSAGRCAWRKDG
jgi:hypothetical protein